VTAMDLPYYILIGAGALIMTAALFFKRVRTAGLDGNTPPQAPWDKADMEKSLQRFLNQIKHEQKAAEVRFTQASAALAEEVAELKQRLARAESELAAWRAAGQAAVSGAPGEREEELADAFALRERYRRVFDLLQEGLAADEIAKRLGAGQGEIELILSLAGPRERGNADAQA
jgi:DNA-directed RNA polymerase specialized sigma24 family protein